MPHSDTHMPRCPHEHAKIRHPHAPNPTRTCSIFGTHMATEPVHDFKLIVACCLVADGAVRHQQLRSAFHRHNRRSCTGTTSYHFTCFTFVLSDSHLCLYRVEKKGHKSCVLDLNCTRPPMQKNARLHLHTYTVNWNHAHVCMYESNRTCTRMRVRTFMHTGILKRHTCTLTPARVPLPRGFVGHTYAR
jgi:hypothetical protein